MKAITISLAIPVLLFMASCSSQVVGIYNPGSLTRPPQSFHVLVDHKDSNVSAEQQQFDERLIDIITSSLESKGLKQSSLPDLYVSFIISVHSSEEINETAYSPYDYRFRYYNYYDPTRFNSRTYKEGILIIDIRNLDNQLVWQGSKSFKLSARNSSTDELITSCREIIAEFDPQLAK